MLHSLYRVAFRARLLVTEIFSSASIDCGGRKNANRTTTTASLPTATFENLPSPPHEMTTLPPWTAAITLFVVSTVMFVIPLVLSFQVTKQQQLITTTGPVVALVLACSAMGTSAHAIYPPAPQAGMMAMLTANYALFLCAAMFNEASSTDDMSFMLATQTSPATRKTPFIFPLTYIISLLILIAAGIWYFMTQNNSIWGFLSIIGVVAFSDLLLLACPHATSSFRVRRVGSILFVGLLIRLIIVCSIPHYPYGLFISYAVTGSYLATILIHEMFARDRTHRTNLVRISILLVISSLIVIIITILVGLAETKSNVHVMTLLPDIVPQPLVPPVPPPSNSSTFTYATTHGISTPDSWMGGLIAIYFVGLVLVTNVANHTTTYFYLGWIVAFIMSWGCAILLEAVALVTNSDDYGYVMLILLVIAFGYPILVLLHKAWIQWDAQDYATDCKVAMELALLAFGFVISWAIATALLSELPWFVVLDVVLEYVTLFIWGVAFNLVFHRNKVNVIWPGILTGLALHSTGLGLVIGLSSQVPLLAISIFFALPLIISLPVFVMTRATWALAINFTCAGTLMICLWVSFGPMVGVPALVVVACMLMMLLLCTRGFAAAVVVITMTCMLSVTCIILACVVEWLPQWLAASSITYGISAFVFIMCLALGMGVVKPLINTVMMTNVHSSFYVYDMNGVRRFFNSPLVFVDVETDVVVSIGEESSYMLQIIVGVIFACGVVGFSTWLATLSVESIAGIFVWSSSTMLLCLVEWYTRMNPLQQFRHVHQALLLATNPSFDIVMTHVHKKCNALKLLDSSTMRLRAMTMAEQTQLYPTLFFTVVSSLTNWVNNLNVRDAMSSQQRHTGLFFDEDFDPSTVLLTTDEELHRVAMEEAISLATWYRPTEIKPQTCGLRRRLDPPYSEELGDLLKFKPPAVDASEVIQGDLNDCWLLTALSVMATHEVLLNRVLPATCLSEDGAMEVWLFDSQVGQFQPIVIDDRLPCEQVDGMENEWQPMFARSKSGEVFWMSLIEKACAKKRGGYVELERGQGTDGLILLTGGFVELISVSKFKGNNSMDAAWARIMQACGRGDLLVATSSQSATARLAHEGENILDSHAYCVMATHELLDRRGQHRLILLHDNTGLSTWQGAWSDVTQWTERARKLLRVPDVQEFWIDFADFVGLFSWVFACRLWVNGVHIRDVPRAVKVVCGGGGGDGWRLRDKYEFAPKFLCHGGGAGGHVFATVVWDGLDGNAKSMSFVAFRVVDGQTGGKHVIAASIKARRRGTRYLSLEFDLGKDEKVMLVPAVGGIDEKMFLGQQVMTCRVEVFDVSEGGKMGIQLVMVDDDDYTASPDQHPGDIGVVVPKDVVGI